MQDADDQSEMPRAAAAPTTTVLGRRAEDFAMRHLECAGLRLLTRNYRCRGGEIDLVMLDAEARVLVLVEVRSRSRADFGGAAATIGFGKQRRLTLAARHLLMSRRELRRLRARFDVVAIDPPARPGGKPQVTWIRGAFGSV
ncbi:MAG TPA: YraN family protein [Steroidobacteraceae bacterium]|nr:YraN family protein [Steroidobacteraceae bacterium]